MGYLIARSISQLCFDFSIIISQEIKTSESFLSLVIVIVESGINSLTCPYFPNTLKNSSFIFA